MGRVTNNNPINKSISFSENTIKAAQKTLITLIAAAALAAALTGAYLLVQHNYTLLSFENTIGLTVTSSVVAFASALTLFFISRERTQTTKATTSPAAKPLPKPAAPSSQQAKVAPTFKLPNLNPYKSPLKCLNAAEQRHLAKTLGRDEYCEILSDWGNELAILERDRFFLVDCDGRVTSIRMNNKAETELPADPALTDYSSVRNSLKDKKNVSSEVQQRVKDFPKKISKAEADSLPKFLKPGEYTTFTLPKGEKRVVCSSDLTGLQFKKFADNGETEDQLYTGENEKVFECDTFTTYLASLKTFEVKFVSIDELISRKAVFELHDAPLQTATSPLLNPRYHVQSLFYPSEHLPPPLAGFMVITKDEQARFTSRLCNNEFFCCEVDGQKMVISRNHEGTLETFTDPKKADEMRASNCGELTDLRMLMRMPSDMAWALAQKLKEGEYTHTTDMTRCVITLVGRFGPDLVKSEFSLRGCALTPNKTLGGYDESDDRDYFKKRIAAAKSNQGLTFVHPSDLETR